MTQAQLLSEFSLLPLTQPPEIAQAIVAQQSQTVSQLLNGQSRHKTLAEAAKILVDDYREDAELTDLKALDREPFYA